MKRLVLTLVIAVTSVVFGQVTVINKAGHWNIVNAPSLFQASFFNISVVRVGIPLPPTDILYGRGNFDSYWMYFWATKELRDAGDTTTAIAGVRGGSGQCLGPGSATCLLTLTQRNSSGYTITMQYDKSLSIETTVNMDIGTMNVTASMVQKAISEAGDSTAIKGLYIDSLVTGMVRGDSIKLSGNSFITYGSGGIIIYENGTAIAAFKQGVGLIAIGPLRIQGNTGFYNSAPVPQCNVPAGPIPNPVMQMSAYLEYVEAQKECLGPDKLNLLGEQ